MPAILSQVVSLLFAADSIWSVIIRGVVWLAIALVIIASLDHPDPSKSFKNLKSNLGFLLLFIILSGTLVFLLFGFTPLAIAKI